MNCKPGDLAYIIHPSMRGKLVTVLHAAPDQRIFLLPNGTPQVGGQEPGDWVIEAMGAPFNVVRAPDISSTNRFAVTNDRWLRPIRGNDGTDETLTWAPKPEKVEA